MTDEQRARMMGKRNALGCHRSEETRAKQSAGQMGRIKSPETCAKLSSALKGRTSPNKGIPMSSEQKAQLSAAHWKGGPRVNWAKHKAKRRSLGFNSLNSPFPGSEGHHVDNELVINMPHKLHRSVYHRQSDGRGMAQINAIAYNFLFKQEVEAALAKVTT